MSFTEELQQFAIDSIGSAEEFIRKSALEIYVGVTVASPVDTGRFKGNWNVSIGAKNYSINQNAKSSPYGSGATDIAAVNAQVRVFKGDGSIFISNGLPYSARLETGYSKQAPVGMVDVTLIDYKARLAKQIAKQI